MSVSAPTRKQNETVSERDIDSEEQSNSEESVKTEDMAKMDNDLIQSKNESNDVHGYN